MPGAFRHSSNPEPAMGPQPPPVAPKSGAPKITMQTWQSAPKMAEPTADEALNYGHHVRCGSLDSVDSNSSSSVSSSSSGSHSRQLSNEGEYLPTRTIVKTPTLPPNNPLQFVKVQSPLYKKAEHQIKLAKEVKITKETLKETEEEWQSNLDNWKSRRRKVSEKVIQRAEEMRQIEAEEQFRQLKEQQRKIKTFSEMVEKRSTKRSYNLDLYIGQGDDSGVGGTPEPDEQDGILDGQHTNIRSDTSEGMTSETDSIDSDAHISEKNSKEPPKVPKKPHSWLNRKNSNDVIIHRTTSPNDLLHHCLTKDPVTSENISSSEPSDIEGHVADTETVSSEDDAGFCGRVQTVDSGLESLCDNRRPNDTADSASDLSQDSLSGMYKMSSDIEPELASCADTGKARRKLRQLSKERSIRDDDDYDLDCDGEKFRILIIAKQDSKGFGFNFKGGKNQDSEAVVESVRPGGAADLSGLKVGDKILSMNGEPTAAYSHSSLAFSVKQASYAGQLELVVNRPCVKEILMAEEKHKPGKRGASFAEKIAIFSGSSSNQQKLNSSQAKEEVKSLVSRRRSAFEKSPADKDDTKDRRSSCVSPESARENEERRLSLEFSTTLEKSPDAGIRRPPPPIPAKPKGKARSYNASDMHQESNDIISDSKLYAIDGSAVLNGKNEYVLSNGAHDRNSLSNYLDEFSSIPEDELSDVFENAAETLRNAAEERTKSSHSKANLQMDMSSTNIVYSSAEDESINSQQLSVSGNTVSTVNGEVLLDKSEETDSYVDNVSNLENSVSNCATSEIKNGAEFYDSTETNENFAEVPVLDTPSSKLDGADDTEVTFRSVVYLETVTSNHISRVQIESSDKPLFKEEDDVTYSVKESSEISDTYDKELPDSPPNAGEDLIIETDVSDVAREHFVQMSVHPLGMLLEKIDEDDVISGSTNTSSSDTTPDTETVIDSCPTCISPPPLPHDDAIEVIDTSSSSQTVTSDNSPMYIQEQIPTQTSSDIMTEEPSFENPERFLESDRTAPSNIITEEHSYENLERFPESEHIAPSDVITEENSFEKLERFPGSDHVTPSNVITEERSFENLERFPGSDHVTTIGDIAEEDSFQDLETFPQSDRIQYSEDAVNIMQEVCKENEELCAEIEESIDQLSPLDVIDQIELRLMQQLEQEALEDLTDASNEQLEEEVNRELMYLSDDADLIEDLDAPRNAVPPSEPPPPPPEPEKLDSKGNPFQRINSTKRIKKEIWRRRSDFLGLDSPKGITIDDLPPPPPGLEEILKSEMEIQREQRLFIEKRLSLADSEYTSIPDSLSSATELSSVYSPSKEYTQEYMLEVVDAEGYSAVAPDEPQSEDWKTNEECYNIPLSETDIQKTALRNTEKEPLKQAESPQHKVKNHIQSLGAAPRAKIMDSNKWITQAEQHVPLTKRVTIDPLFREGAYNQNYWIQQEAGKRSSMERTHVPVDRRYSMPPAYGTSTRHPDVTVRTWSDREAEYELHPRPKSGIWSGHSPTAAQQYSTYTHSNYFSSQSPSWPEPATRCLEEEEKPQFDVSHQCSCCGLALTEGSAMGIDALQLYFHLECFRCCMCQLQLGNGSCGTDVQVKSSQLYCPKCFMIE